ncbi:MAG: hypothetical protein ACUVWJ_12345 [Spirochaetota bacterium]
MINYHVELCEDRHYYSARYLRKRGEKTKVKVIYNDRMVAIYYENVWIAQHKRDQPPNGYSTLPEHMPLNHRYVAEWSPERFMRLARAVGEDVNLVVEKMLGSRKHPEQAFKVCMGVLNHCEKDQFYQELCAGKGVTLRSMRDLNPRPMALEA